MTAGVLLGMNQLEIHGKWWYLFYACDVFFFNLLPHPGFGLLMNHLLALCFLCYP